MNNGLNEIRKHVELYFKRYLPQYTVLEIRKKSYHPADHYLYMVSAKSNDGTFAVWTAWNETSQSLNFGHYNLKSMEECEKVFKEFYYNG
ncbi:MAG: hypothetical protein NC489_47225 [Ruminococcus flavefaciens]|nr:hypothetical protein [Ruminococcus flavefaciens]